MCVSCLCGCALLSDISVQTRTLPLLPPAAAMRFWYDGQTAELVVSAQTPLRILQEDLCMLFAQRFPAMMASVKVGDITYTDFDDMPFLVDQARCNSHTIPLALRILCAAEKASYSGTVDLVSNLSVQY